MSAIDDVIEQGKADTLCTVPMQRLEDAGTADHSKVDDDAGEGEITNAAAEPPERGAPVSPSPIRGAATEKDRVSKARLAATAGRMIVWRSIVCSDLER